MNVDEDARTLWCGNLSEKVTEDVLYELFLQGGPVERVCIPKDRDGKQRSFGFITYKHVNSVSYAVNLFDGTTLFNRPISMKARNNVESGRVEQQPQERYNVNDVLLLGHQMLLGNSPLNMNLPTFGINAVPNNIQHPYQTEPHLHNHDRRPRRMHPYQREHDGDKGTDKREQYDRGKNQQRDHRSYRNKSDYRLSDHSRHDNHRNHRRNYR